MPKPMSPMLAWKLSALLHWLALPILHIHALKPEHLFQNVPVRLNGSESELEISCHFLLFQIFPQAKIGNLYVIFINNFLDSAHLSLNVLRDNHHLFLIPSPLFQSQGKEF